MYGSRVDAATDLASPIAEPPPSATNPSAFALFNCSLTRSKASRGMLGTAASQIPALAAPKAAATCSARSLRPLEQSTSTRDSLARAASAASSLTAPLPNTVRVGGLE
jgi:hypothetical protein